MTKLTPSEILRNILIKRELVLAGDKSTIELCLSGEEIEQALKQLEIYYGAEFYRRFENELKGKIIPYGRTTDKDVILMMDEIKEAAQKASRFNQ